MQSVSVQFALKQQHSYGTQRHSQCSLRSDASPEIRILFSCGNTYKWENSNKRNRFKRKQSTNGRFLFRSLLYTRTVDVCVCFFSSITGKQSKSYIYCRLSE